MDSTLVSVIVPVFNTGKYLQDCLDSIIGQTYKNLEILLIDDGSTDESGKICDTYSTRDTRIKAFHRENQGVSAARNFGIEHCTADWLMFVDADDVLHRELINTVLSIAEQQKSDIVEFGYKKFINQLPNVDVIDYKLESFSGREMLRNLFMPGMGIQTDAVWSKIYRKELWNTIRFPLNKRFEDTATSYQVLYKANKVTYVNSELYFYRLSDRSFTAQQYDLQQFDQIDAMVDRCAFFKSNVDEYTYYLSVRYLYYECLRHKYMMERHSLNDSAHYESLKSITDKAHRELWKSKYLTGKTKIRVWLSRAFPGIYKYLFLSKG